MNPDEVCLSLNCLKLYLEYMLVYNETSFLQQFSARKTWHVTTERQHPFFLPTSDLCQDNDACSVHSGQNKHYWQAVTNA